MDPSDETAFRTIQRRVRGRLDELGLDMKTASLNAGLGETFVRDLLKRGRAPSTEALQKLATALGTNAAWLMGEDADRDPLPGGDIGLVTVPEFDVRLSAGPGALVESEHQTGVWQFSRHYLVDQLRLDPRNLAIVEVQGDSMSPTLLAGDRVLIDHSSNNAAQPGVYAIWDSNATVVKRVERVPASDPPMLALISDNKNHNQYTVPAEFVHIIGRVVWYGRRL